MIIYLEGPDGSGKTTLANRIAEDLGKDYKVIRNGEELVSTKPDSPNRVASEKDLVDKLNEFSVSKDIYISDRGPISDVVYRIFDDYEPVTSLPMIKKILEAFSPALCVIYCHQENSEQLMLERGDDNPVAIAHHKEICKVYDMAFAMLSELNDELPVIYNYDSFAKSDGIVEALRKHTELFMNAIGTLNKNDDNDENN